jgi:hypothetical protein
MHRPCIELADNRNTPGLLPAPGKLQQLSHCWALSANEQVRTDYCHKESVTMEHTQTILSGATLGKIMLARISNTDGDNAWAQGDLAYDLGDTFETGVAKAARAGIRPGSSEYAAFITAFSRRVRSMQVSPKKTAYA